ncbi:glutathione S-transferase N-terminal domain-containing protein [Stappia taiwanensis]|uniref:Glutathione S-transferase N-terminal domain-containing protein n=1 Tax=Stappia taiwanensis TaxID=992267 RepID=A0A838XJX6_9HYPH|nr:glutathione S-transferase N-terminal domain-containing protein [Stappia taiwanensis]MBA4610177.1 glutathione S-transferase N-terminal domain-containing protein [Stappia taiwanensis]GGE77439.1 thiol:disulfide oxidoreductase [Stappia taiwanensis]
MIDLYTWSTPNGRKVSIMLEECGLDYTVYPVDIRNREQHRPAFVQISPNSKIPAIIDREAGVSLMESGAILLYLAEKTGKLLPPSGPARLRVIEWLMWQMGGLGPMLGQAHHFLHFNPGRAAYAEERYHGEAARLYRVLDGQLRDHEFVAGEYSIADVSIWPWISRFEWQRIDLADFPNVRRWYETLAARPAVQKGYDVPEKTNPVPMPGDRPGLSLVAEPESGPEIGAE